MEERAKVDKETAKAAAEEFGKRIREAVQSGNNPSEAIKEAVGDLLKTIGVPKSIDNDNCDEE